MKFRLFLLLLACSALAAPRCENVMLAKWDRFATDANSYMSVFAIAGRADAKRAKQRLKLQDEWEAVISCECF